MPILCRQLNEHACKTYLVMRQGSRNAVLVDPVIGSVDRYLSLLREEGLTLTHVIDTHTHADHISGGALLKAKTPCSYLMYNSAPASCADARVTEGELLRLPDGITARVIHTPGHTADSISLVFDEFVFTGDALFLDDGGAGRDDLPGGDPGDHWESLQKLAALPDNLIVFPAHDYRDRAPSSLGTQKRTNPHLKERTKQEFIDYINELVLGPADWMKDVLAANYGCTTDPNAAWIPPDEPVCEVGGTMESETGGIEVPLVSVAELREKLADGNPPVLLDVRNPDELTGELGHIAGITHIPVKALKDRIGELDPARETVTICKAGTRSLTAARMLAKAGFANVSVLDGGMLAWNKGE
jgi:glyoxylase-like metal-dependent hydrolase (beta-lactamase superfamily II)/rhodanese-related sulfurtransferase